MSELDKDGLRLDPQRGRRTENMRYRDDDTWFYEDRRGLFCYVKFEGSVRSFVIPRKAIMEYAHIVKSI